MTDDKTEVETFMGNMTIEESRLPFNHNSELVKQFKCYSDGDQLSLLTSLLTVASPEVKYHFQLLVEEITMYDIISEVPREISEKILMMLDLPSLLKCRQVCHSWNILISQCSVIWLPFMFKNGIDHNGFTSMNEKGGCYLNDDYRCKNLNVIGEGMKFDLTVQKTNLPDDHCITINNLSYFKKYVMGRKILKNFKSLSGFHHIIDHDCCGSNLVMAMNEEIIAYAREDRHIVVKYANFPHKKICVFEAHQVADMKIWNDKLITGGYNRSICIWYWESGELFCCLEESIKPVLSLDVIGELLVSSDGKSIITWDLGNEVMLVKWPCFNDDGIVEELVIVDPTNCRKLNEKYNDLILVSRSYHQLKIWLLYKNGTSKFLSTLTFHKEIHHLQPYVKITEHVLSCSSEYGVLMWNLVDFSFISQTERKPCKTCQFTSDYCRHTRVLLLFHSWSHILEYFVYGNYFNLLCLRKNEEKGFRWSYPSDEKWPWAHRKPGMACIISNLDHGFTESTKLVMFVATQHRKIYCMIFDASDLEENYDYQISEVISGSRTWNTLIND